MNAALAWTAPAVVLSYVLGSLPTGLWLGLWLRGVDIREHGSKNIGATNTLRVLGKKLGILALLGDAGKGVAAVLLVARLSPWEYAPLVCGVAAILGHTFSLFLRFRGGKGVATSAGVFFALCPWPALVALVVFAVALFATHMVSAGSVAAALALAAAVFFWPYGPLLRAFAVFIAVLIVVRHRANITRILNGTENRLW